MDKISEKQSFMNHEEGRLFRKKKEKQVAKQNRGKKEVTRYSAIGATLQDGGNLIIQD